MNLRLEDEIKFDYPDIIFFSKENIKNSKVIQRAELKNGLTYPVKDIMRGSLFFAKDCAEDLRYELDAEEPITAEYILNLKGRKRVVADKMVAKFNDALKPFIDCAKSLDIENKECLYIVLAYGWREDNNVVIDWLVDDIFNKDYEGRSQYNKSAFITPEWEDFREKTFYSEEFGTNTFINLFTKSAKESGLCFSDILRPIENFESNKLCRLYCLFEMNNKKNIISLSAESQKIQDKKKYLRYVALPEFFELIHENRLKNEVNIVYNENSSTEVLRAYESMTLESKADYIAKDIERWIKDKKNIGYIDTVSAVLKSISDYYPEVTEKIEKNVFTNSLFDDLGEKNGVFEFFINPNILYKMIMFEKNPSNVLLTRKGKEHALMTINGLKFKSVYMEQEVGAVYDAFEEYKLMRGMIYDTTDEKDIRDLYPDSGLMEPKRLLREAKLGMLERFMGEINKIIDGTDVQLKYHKVNIDVEGEDVPGLKVQCDSELVEMVKGWFVNISMAGPTFVEEEVMKGVIELDDYLMRESLLVNREPEDERELSSKRRIKF